jgi:hypothetical protein
MAFASWLRHEEMREEEFKNTRKNNSKHLCGLELRQLGLGMS